MVLGGDSRHREVSRRLQEDHHLLGRGRCARDRYPHRCPQNKCPPSKWDRCLQDKCRPRDGYPHLQDKCLRLQRRWDRCPQDKCLLDRCLMDKWPLDRCRSQARCLSPQDKWPYPRDRCLWVKHHQGMANRLQDRRLRVRRH